MTPSSPPLAVPADTRTDDVPPDELEAALRREGAARLAAEQALGREYAARTEREANLLATLAAARMGTWRMDAYTGQVTWDAALNELLGLPAVSGSGPTPGWRRWVHPEDEGRVDAELRRALREASGFSLDYRIVRPDGGVRWMRDRGGVLFGEDGTPRYLTGVASDISADKQAEQDALVHADLDQRLIGIVSHDLRNPLSAIIMGAHMLMHRVKEDAKSRQVVTHLLSSAERCHRMVRDLLDYTQAELGGGIRIESRPLDFHALVAQAVQEVRLSFGPDRDFHVRHEGDATGEWDADRLTQVITNLVCNAVNYSPENTPIEVTSSGDDTHVVFSVRNQGEPIPLELRTRIFEPMTRGLSRGAQVSRGVGLGLYIVKHLVDAHEGRVDVESSEAQGTCFSIRLPRQRTARRP
ncbi:sensor histidine kinase [Archangium primigenium]|uniref:sensor histidine kinase n=1 Tax=[Archangium] primigenium TaxID=2792470 RepID=UPI00195D8A4A|nr:HAMP domain-containing sensor histidine kinase [Archangium primigenium]MBM7113241.1 PAS domain-containing protein [Archangium primigenium]